MEPVSNQAPPRPINSAESFLFYKYLFNLFISEVWVTNKYLEEKVRQQLSRNKMNIKLITINNYEPYPLKKVYKIAYLGTSSHTKELFWLKTLFIFL